MNLTGVAGAVALALAAPPQAADVVDRHPQAVGGSEAGKITAWVRRGDLQIGEGFTGTFELAGQTPDRWRLDVTLPGVLAMVQIRDGKAGWTLTPDGTFPTPQRQRAELEMAAHFAPALRTKEYLVDAVVKGRERQGRREVWVVEAQRSGGQVITAHFDTGTGLFARLGNT